MARGKRSSRRRRDEDHVPAVGAVPTGDGGHGRGRERAARIPGGPGFALILALAGGVVGALLAFLGSFLLGASSGGGLASPLDAGGVAGVRMLASVDVDRWAPDFGTTAAVRKQVDNEFRKRTSAVKKKDERDGEAVDEAIDEWRNGTWRSNTAYVPGFDKLFPATNIKDDNIRNARKNAMKWAMGNDRHAFLGAAVQDINGQVLLAEGTQFSLPPQTVQKFGDTQVFAAKAEGRPIRMFRHPMRDRKGNAGGYALLFLRADLAQQSDPMTSAAAGAGLAFIGVFLVVLLMGLGPVKAVRRLAVETDALGRGELGTRVTTRGPVSVVAAAKAVQRLAQLAAQGGGGAAAPPEIVTEQVIVQPTEEISFGLSPSKSFRRPEAFEIEATSKQCPDAGNDYFDMINVDDAHVGFFIADVPVRGVQGFAYMSQIRSLFRSEAKRSNSPTEVLKAVNRAFAVDLPRGVYVTAMYAVLDTTTGIVRVASAQHLPLVFWKLAKKASARLQPEGIALGLDAGPVFDKTVVEKAIQLERGDRVVMFTDGAISARDAHGAIYGDEKFYYVVNREAPKNSAAFVNFVANDVDLFHQGAPQLDDFTILTVRRLK